MSHFTSNVAEEKIEVLESPPFYSSDSVWVNHTLANLSLDEKIAQLFMVAAYSNKGPSHRQEIENLIKNYQIGGLMFMQGGPTKTIATNQRLSIDEQHSINDCTRCRMGTIYAY